MPAPCPTTPAAVQPAPVSQRAPNVDDVQKQLVAFYNARDAKGSYALFDSGMRGAVPFESQGPFIEGVLSRGALGDAKRVSGDGASHGVYDVKSERGAWHMDIHVDAEGKIAGMRITPIDPEPPVAKSTLAMGLPFRGTWSVFWGGDTAAVNAHVSIPSQRRAADLVKVDAEGKDHKGDGKSNSDHFCFGSDLLAVADGVVITAVDGIPDNTPGQMDKYFVPGNAVILAHAGNVHSMYGHIKLHSVRVREGAKVKRGTVLGLCGNSGNSSQPHLHFQLQDGPRMDASWGIDAVFSDVRLTRGGKTETASPYTFLKGDRIDAR